MNPRTINQLIPAILRPYTGRMPRCFILLFTLIGCSGLTAVAQELEPPQVAREKVAKWVETRQLITKESTQWEAEKSMLTELIKLRERESKKMDEVIDLAKERVADIEKKAKDLSDEENSRQRWRDNFEKRITALEDALIPQLNYLPSPVKDKVFEAITRVEDRDDEGDLQGRFRDIIAILNECITFNSQLFSAPEIRMIDGKEIEVDVLYIGLNQAWYVDRTGKIAGTGSPSSEGWVWTSEPSIAGNVRKAIDVFNKEAAPDFAKLPLGSK